MITNFSMVCPFPIEPELLMLNGDMGLYALFFIGTFDGLSVMCVPYDDDKEVVTLFETQDFFKFTQITQMIEMFVFQNYKSNPEILKSYINQAIEETSKGYKPLSFLSRLTLN